MRPADRRRLWRSLGAKAFLAVAILAALAAACTSILGVKDPTLEDPGGGGDDAAIDAPTDAAIDASVDAPIDAPIDAAIDAPPPPIWVFVTDASSRGDFGATAGARTTADIRCQGMYDANFTARNCTRANIHAVLQVDNVDDTLARMATRFSIPATSEVFRATDGMRVTDRWDTLVNPNAILLIPVSAAAPPLRFWSGRGLTTNSQCAGWTSAAATMVGDAGDATAVNGWTSQGARNCNDLDPHLLCVCW